MAQAVSASNVEALIEGQISGQVAVGNNIAQIGSNHGIVVNVIQPGQQPSSRPRPTPVQPSLRPFESLLDRTSEIEAATAAFRSSQPIELRGQEGIGKTSLLRYLAHHPPANVFPDGVAYMPARHQPLMDLLQSLYDAFYESDPSFKPTPTQIGYALQNKKAIVLLDDVELARDEVAALMDAAQGCVFVLTSSERHLWGEGQSVTMRGIPQADALGLIEREMERPLTSEEQVAARTLYTALEGHPLRLLQAVAMARDDRRSLADIARAVQTPSPSQSLTVQTLPSLSNPEQLVVMALAVLGGAPLNVESLSTLTGQANVVPVLEALQRRGLMQAHSPRYSLTGDLGQFLQQGHDLTAWAERILSYLTGWAETQQGVPERLLEQADAIVQMIGWGVRAGRWNDVLRLGRAVESALALGKRWGAWGQVLQWMLQAAQAQGERAAEAWALHQLGSRALCLGGMNIARSQLIQALRLREGSGDQAGAAVTRHNLNLLLGTPPSPSHSSTPPSTTGPAASGVSPWLTGLVAFVVITFLTAGGVGAWLLWPRSTPTPFVRSTPTSVPSPTSGPSPTWTPTPTHTQTPTFTPTSTRTWTPTSTRTRTPTATPTRTRTPTSTRTRTPTPTRTPTSTPDTTGPVIARVSASPSSIWYDPSCGPSGAKDTTTIAAAILDPAKISSARIYYRSAKSGSKPVIGAWTSAAMSPVGIAAYQKVIAAKDIPSPRGDLLEYYLRATDSFGNATQTGISRVTVHRCPEG
jgi:hypothetical protein